MSNPSRPINFQSTREALGAFFAEFGNEPKVAEDPNRPGITPQDMTEGKHQTDETGKGDGGASYQGALGKEMANEVKQVAGEGGSVENAPANSGDSTAVGIHDPATATVSPSPADDIDKMDNVPPEVKEAAAEYAHFYRLGNAVMDMIDQYFDQNAAKNASDMAAKEAADVQAIQQRAREMKAAHIDYLVQKTGCTPKEANDLLNKIAEENPAAILPPEALSDEEIQTTLADAAAADAADAEAGVPADMTPVEGAPAGDDVDAEIEEVVEELKAEGFSEEEIAQALEQAVAEAEGGEAPSAEPPAEEPKVAEDPTPAPVAADPAGAEPAPEEPVAEPPAGGEGAGDMEAVQAELEQVAQQLEQEGYSQEEIADAIMQEMGITPDDVVDIVVENMKEQGGLSDEEARELLNNLGQLEAQGVTPEQFAEALGQQQ